MTEMPVCKICGWKPEPIANWKEQVYQHLLKGHKRGCRFTAGEMKTMEQYTDLKLIHQEVFDSVRAENERQIKKWGVQTHSLFEWQNYTTEELGELAKAISELEYRNGLLTDVYDEAIQTATLCLKIAEMVAFQKLKTKKVPVGNGGQNEKR